MNTDQHGSKTAATTHEQEWTRIKTGPRIRAAKNLEPQNEQKMHLK
jgi:hypothetical protein